MGPSMDRGALLAGSFYPAAATECRDAIEHHTREAAVGVQPRGAIAPHAGWAYSGDCAGRTHRSLAEAHQDATLVVVFGSHRGPLGPNTVFVGSGWSTPVGRLETHSLSHVVLTELGLDVEPVSPARADNGAELHLPFVRQLFPRAALLMLGVAAAPIALALGRRVGQLAQASGESAVFVGSTDLTHYGPNYGFFRPAHEDTPDAVEWVREENDAGFLSAVLRDDADGALAHASRHSSACCPGAAVAALEAVRAYRGHVEPVLVDHCLSYDVAPGDSFVGYGGVVF